MWACRDLRRINTSAVLRTYGICHLPLGKRLSLGSAAAPPPTLSSHLSLSDFPFLSLLLSGFKGLKCFSCLLCIKCPFRSPVLPSARPPPTLRSVKRKMAQRRRGCWRCEAFAERGWSHHRKVFVFNSMLGSQAGRRWEESDTCYRQTGSHCFAFMTQKQQSIYALFSFEFFSFVSVPANCCLTHLMSSFYS